MVFVEGGEFQMGDFGWPYDDDPANLCDWPCGVEPARMGRITMFGNDDFVHPVKLSSYYLSKFQVKLEDFDLFFTAQGKPVFDAEDRKREKLQNLYQANLPAPTESWQEAKDYCGWLGQLSGYAVDLPTEAQWEYAARSRGLHVVFPTDNGSLNYGRNFPEPDEIDTFPVDRFAPNPLGIYNLSGNATDWVNDWYDKNYYLHSPVENPQGPDTGTQRIRRGTSVLEDTVATASTVRRWGDDPIQKIYNPGASFRCAIQSEKTF
ncbi:Serine/threonine-protein kinase pkn1 [compost metagenome]